MRPRAWHCHDRFHGMQPGTTAGGIVVVIDVLRASTSIVTALAGGAEGVLAASTPDGARRAAEEAGRPAGRCLLGGERGGARIEGFDLGNSPAEYGAAVVSGRSIVTTTTNGTAAIAACPRAAAILVGCLVNRTAVARVAASLAAGAVPPAPVHLVCAGTDGMPTDEDLLGAGAILDAAGPAAVPLMDAGALEALGRWHDTVAGAADTGPALVAALERSQGGRNLLAIGMGDDIPLAAAVDTSAVVPRRDDRDGWFRPAR